jgi:hypothetical protein
MTLCFCDLVGRGVLGRLIKLKRRCIVGEEIRVGKKSALCPPLLPQIGLVTANEFKAWQD